MFTADVSSKILLNSTVNWTIRRIDFSTRVGHPVHPGYLVAIATPQYPGNLGPINGWILMGITEATQNGAWKFPNQVSDLSNYLDTLIVCVGQPRLLDFRTRKHQAILM
jgi:hypothetical protein